MNTIPVMNTEASPLTGVPAPAKPRPDGREDKRPGTRQKLIEAGIRLFGLHGFEATGTRSLAAAAGVNLAAIPYHFGGKEGLYHAVARHIVAAKNAALGRAFEDIRSLCADPLATPDRLREAMRAMIHALAADTLESSDSQDASRIMIQEQIAPTSAFDIFYEGFFRQALEAWTGLLARLTGQDPASPDLKLRAIALLGQIVIFRVGASTTLRHMGCARFTPEHVRRIADMTISRIEECIGPAPAPEAAP
jgi:AcrR family transcriptional regulator